MNAHHHLQRYSLAAAVAGAVLTPTECPGHGTVVAPMSRVYRVYKSNPERPSFALAANAVRTDGKQSYYTWNELSRNIPQAVRAGLPPGFDYSPWIPDGQLASAGRVDPNSKVYPRTYAGLDQVSLDWPKTSVVAGQTITIDFLATAPHDPSVWDVWMTTPDWDPASPLRWSQMQFLGRPRVTLANGHYTFQLPIPTDRSGHHVLWIAWQRNDPVGEAFFSTSDLDIRPANDACQGARPVGAGRSGPYSTVGATSSAPAASCGTAGGDLWFSYVATCTGTLRADTCATTGGFDSVVSIWSGSCGGLTEVGCDDNTCGLLSAAKAPVTANTRYLIRVGGQRGKPPGRFALTISYDNGSGRFSRSSTGCGAATLRATGAPNLGGIVGYAVVGGRGSTQALWVGTSPASVSLCSGCTVGTVPRVALPSSVAMTIPCDRSLIGGFWYVQGADAVGTRGGCTLGGVDFTLTDTIRIDIGR